MKILETSRLLLRHPMPEDLDSLYALYSDPEVTRCIPDAPRTYQETQEELEWFGNGHPKFPQLGLWATIYKETNRFIGRCGLLPWTIKGREEVEVAFLLASEYWGNGLGTEVAQGIARYALEQLHITRLICLIDPRNQASIGVARRLGMDLEQELEHELGRCLMYATSRMSDGTSRR
jgi:RimJ/RimL family protein N-acetyltransferase